MDARDTITPRQFLALAFVALLSPIIRRMPRSLLMLSGGAAWLAPPIAVLPCLGIFLLLHRCLRSGKGLGQLLDESVGRFFGRLLTALASLWLVFYCGFLLHSAAHRLVSTLYADSSPALFIVLTAALCLPAAMGPFRALGRWAMLFRPLLLAVLAAVTVFALGSCRFTGVLPVTKEDALPALESGFAVLNTLSLAVYLCFAAGRCRGEGRPRGFVGWCIVLLVIVELVTLGCLSIFGTELSLKLNYPFFMLVRDISIFDSLARMEALVIALWMVTDVVLVSLLLRVASDNLRQCFGAGVPAEPESFWSLRSLRWLTPALCGLAAAAALCIPGDILTLGRLSEEIVPLTNAALIFGLFPLALLIGRLRGKI